MLSSVHSYPRAPRFVVVISGLTARRLIGSKGHCLIPAGELESGYFGRDLSDNFVVDSKCAQ